MLRIVHEVSLSSAFALAKSFEKLTFMHIPH